MSVVSLWTNLELQNSSQVWAAKDSSVNPMAEICWGLVTSTSYLTGTSLMFNFKPYIMVPMKHGSLKSEQIISFHIILVELQWPQHTAHLLQEQDLQLGPHPGDRAGELDVYNNSGPNVNGGLNNLSASFLRRTFSSSTSPFSKEMASWSVSRFSKYLPKLLLSYLFNYINKHPISEFSLCHCYSATKRIIIY